MASTPTDVSDLADALEAELQAYVDRRWRWRHDTGMMPNEPLPMFLKSEFLERIDAPYRRPYRE